MTTPRRLHNTTNKEDAMTTRTMIPLLIAALVLRPEERPAVRRIATAAIAAMLAAELLLNLSGYRVLIAFLMR